MPLLGSGEYVEPVPFQNAAPTKKSSPPGQPIQRRQSQHSAMAKNAIMSQLSTPSTDGARTPEEREAPKEKDTKSFAPHPSEGTLPTATRPGARQYFVNGAALTDTPLTTAPNSPIM